MKPWKLALIILGVGVLVYLAWSELRRDEQQGLRELNELVFPYGSSQVTDLSITFDELNAKFARDQDRVWQLVEGDDSAVVDEVSTIISAWSRVRFLEVVEEEPEDLAIYALDPPRVVLSGTVLKDERTIPSRLEIGMIHPFKPGLYGRIGEQDQVVLLDAAAMNVVEDAARRAFGMEVEERERGVVN